MNVWIALELTALLLAPAPRAKQTATAVKPPTAAPAANDALQSMLSAGELKGSYNPVLLGFLAEEAKGKLPDSQRKAAIEQQVAGFRQQVKVDKSSVAVAHVATAVGAIVGGDVGRAVSAGAAEIWREWVDAAFILQKAGYAAESAAFFETCIRDFALPELRARCTVGLAAQEPERAFSLVLGMVNDKPNAVADEEVVNVGLRLLGEMAGGQGVAQAQKDRAVEELVKRTKGFSNTTHKTAAALGLVATRDPRAVEPLRAMTKGMLKDVEASRIATRGLFLYFKDAEATESLQKKLKGGLLGQPADQVAAALTLIEGGHPAGFEFAAKFLSKKRKEEEIDLAVDLVRGLGRNGSAPAKQVLAQALAAQKPKEWLTAAVAIELLELGDTAGRAIVEAALTRKDWPGTRLEAAVALGRSGDLSGLPVLQDMIAKPSFGKSLKLLATGGNAADPDAVRMEVADALARIDRPEVVPVLFTLLEDRSAAVRSSAAEALVDMHDPAALDGLLRAIEVDYGTLDGRSVNPEQHAALVRGGARRFAQDPRLSVLLKKAADSKLSSVKFLAAAESKVLGL
jgi:HEAT repeat protein